MGVVLGFDHELADVLDVRRHALRDAAKKAKRLGLGEDLLLDGEGRIGFRFGKAAFVWLVGLEKEPPRPRLIEEALAAAVTKKAGGQPPAPTATVDLDAAAFGPTVVDLDDDEGDPLAPPKASSDDGDPWA